MPYERFTDRARKVMAHANQEAMRLNHEYIGTEHILLGLTKEGNGVGTTVLKNLDVDLRKVRLEVEKLVRRGPETGHEGKLPQTPRAKKVIEFAIEEARNLNDNHVGTEHLLLGLIREQDGVAAQVLMNLGLKLEDVREEIMQLLGLSPEAPTEVPAAPQVPAKPVILSKIFVFNDTNPIQATAVNYQQQIDQFFAESDKKFVAMTQSSAVHPRTGVVITQITILYKE